MDIRDSRDVQERINELEALEDDIDEIDKEELEGLIAFKKDMNPAEWDFGITFIEEDDFEDYAREYAEDIGAIGRNMGWPTGHIDWKAAANELLMSYCSVKLGETTYYYR